MGVRTPELVADLSEALLGEAHDLPGENVEWHHDSIEAHVHVPGKGHRCRHGHLADVAVDPSLLPPVCDLMPQLKKRVPRR